VAVKIAGWYPVELLALAVLNNSSFPATSELFVLIEIF
jgi:hypothetical protein